ncbi:hypothetical protein [Haliea sp. E17]|uniref:hypothetical protein n=1 Tax=Haliea sp. E17 TaxID=3401576 RepID=UPI003AAE2571
MDTAATGAAASALPRSAYIVNPAYDWLLFLLPPVAALGLGFVITGTWFSDAGFELAGYDFSPSGLLIGVFIHAHLVAVFFRSHGNPAIFRSFPRRFVLVPLLLYLAMLSSNWALICVSVLATFWDVYHSALQTFGFARIYDNKWGNDPAAGRQLDYWLNLLLYAGPILAGVTMIDHFEDFAEFEEVGATFFTRIPAYMEGHQQYYAWAVIALGCAFLLYYLHAQWRLSRQGYRVSPLKVYLLASTGAVSILTWGFNTWGEAFFIMNFFHALQYFGIVWAREQGNLVRLFRVGSLPNGKYLALALFLGATFGYGLWAELSDTSITALWALTLTVSIMHFWYDSFIWSVRKQQV